MDRLDAMRIFVAVADLGSFAQAGRRMRLSPAAVTRGVAQLEDHLGLSLLSRTTRSVRMTESGALYLEDCRHVLAAFEDAERRARGESAEPRGTLTVAAPIVFGRLHILPLILEMLRTYPRLSIRLALADRIVNLVDEGVDVAVRIGELADSALIARKVSQLQRVLVASPGYLEARGEPRSSRDLAGHDIIAFEGVDSTNDWRFGDDGRLVQRVEPRLMVNSADAAIAAAEAGFGITRALSYQVRAGLLQGRLRLVLQEVAPRPVPVSLVHPAVRLGSANLAAFMTVAARHLGEASFMPPWPAGSEENGS
jgi:DNA-binding transcriptional LysR family regulator